MIRHIESGTRGKGLHEITAAVQGAVTASRTAGAPIGAAA